MSEQYLEEIRITELYNKTVVARWREKMIEILRAPGILPDWTKFHSIVDEMGLYLEKEKYRVGHRDSEKRKEIPAE